LYNLKYKNDTYNILVNFIKIIETQFEVKIKTFKIDNIKKFKSNKFILICTENSTLIEYISPYSAPQNGIVERFNKYIIERLIIIYKNKNISLFL
jgi:transposase InsO family protein